jgi:hypothetical protein
MVIAGCDTGERRYFWLVKWDGYVISTTTLRSHYYKHRLSRYPTSEATWESDDHLGDPQTLVEDFNKTAREEGIELGVENTILLQAAVEGGWESKK